MFPRFSIKSLAQAAVILLTWTSAVSGDYVSCSDICAEPFTELAATGLSQTLICPSSSVFNTFVTQCKACLNNSTIFNTAISLQAGLDVALDLCDGTTDTPRVNNNNTCPGVKCPLLLADVQAMGIKNNTICTILSNVDIQMCSQSGCVTEKDLQPYIQHCSAHTGSSSNNSGAFSKPAVIAAVVIGTMLLCLAAGGYILYFLCLRGRTHKRHYRDNISDVGSIRTWRSSKRKAALTRRESKRVSGLSIPPSLYVNVDRRGRWDEYREVECDEKGYLPVEDAPMISELEGSSTQLGTGIHIVEMDASSPPFHATAFPRGYAQEAEHAPLVPFQAALRPTSSISKHSHKAVEISASFMSSVGSPLQVPHIPTPPQSQQSHFTPRFVSSEHTLSSPPPPIPQLSTDTKSFAESIVPDIYQTPIRPSRSYITVKTCHTPPGPVRAIASPSTAAPLPSRNSSSSIVSNSPPSRPYELPPHARPVSDSFVSPVSTPTSPTRTFSRHSSLAKRLMGRRYK